MTARSRQTAERYANLREACAGREILSFDAGPTSDLVLVSYPGRKRDIADAIKRTWFDLPEPLDLMIHHVVAPDTVISTEVKQHPWQVHHAQPLPGGRWLLMSSRARYRAPDDIDRNAFVYGDSGSPLATFTLGDGIQSLQADAAGAIWASYFDEGVFGNLGWTDPIGWPGLLRWNDRGDLEYEFSPSGGLDSIADCYALNVESTKTTWLYYYTDFPLVRVESGVITGHWAIPVAGADCFAVFEDHVMMVGGYRQPAALHIFRLGPAGQLESVCSLDAELPSGEQVQGLARAARGSRVYFLGSEEIFSIDLRDLL